MKQSISAALLDRRAAVGHALVAGQLLLSFGLLAVMASACGDERADCVGASCSGSTSGGQGGDGHGGDHQGGSTAGQGGAGETGGGAPCIPTIVPSCDDIDDDVYGFSSTDVASSCEGSIVACSVGETVEAGDVQQQLPAGLTAISGYTAHRVAYRTNRGDGSPAVASAMVFEPDTPSASPDAPIVVITHGTAGVADECAPSRYPSAGQPTLIYPWIGAGFTVVAVDYAGLGTEGIQAYGDWRDTGLSVLDGARAGVIWKETHGGLSTAQRIVVVGHSQGGGAAMAAQALNETYAPELDIPRVVAYAGASVLGGNLDGATADFLPFTPLTGAGGAIRAIFALSVYADFGTLFGESAVGDGFHPDVRTRMVNSIGSSCVSTLPALLNTPGPGYTPPNTVGEILEPQILNDVIACLKGEPGCSGRAQAWSESLTTKPPPLSPTGAEVLFIGGADDVIFTPKQFACSVDGLVTANIPHQTCFVADAGHGEVVPTASTAAFDWVTTGQLACPPAATPPSCN